ncbi:hypothetical protein [Photobacterium leiognathi]|nr:hypothetical protein [Photobacterium leiognathi]
MNHFNCVSDFDWLFFDSGSENRGVRGGDQGFCLPDCGMLEMKVLIDDLK